MYCCIASGITTTPDRISERYLVHLSVVVRHQARIVADDDFPFDRVDQIDLADVAIEHFLVVVVLGLDHFVPHAEPESKTLHLYFVRVGSPHRVSSGIGSLKPLSIPFLNETEAISNIFTRD